MPEDMSISVNGNTQVPPGFRFHPTEEELLNYYLKKKVSYEKIDLDVIRDVDLNKLEPWDIQEKCKIGTTPQNDWYFFSHKDKKYPTGTRTNRATTVGFWKATGRDKTILGQGKRIGMRKTLVFYRGRAPHGQKSDWIMHEYRLDDNAGDVHVCNVLGDQSTQEEGWVVCRIFKKKSHHKTLEIPLISSSSIVTELDNAETTQILDEEYPYYSEGAGLGQMLEYMGNSTCKEEAEPNNISPIPNNNNNHPLDSSLTNWSTFDRLVASHLNGQTEAYSRQLVANLFGNDPSNIGYYNPDHHHHSDPSINIQSLRTSISLPSNNYHGEAQQEYYHQLANDEINHIWSFDASTSTRSSSSSDPLHHVSNYSALQNGYLASPTTQRI